jgi:ABC-type lipoprotein release transport system permease subunit
MGHYFLAAFGITLGVIAALVVMSFAVQFAGKFLESFNKSFRAASAKKRMERSLKEVERLTLIRQQKEADLQRTIQNAQKVVDEVMGRKPIAVKGPNEHGH